MKQARRLSLSFLIVVTLCFYFLARQAVSWRPQKVQNAVIGQPGNDYQVLVPDETHVIAFWQQITDADKGLDFAQSAEYEGFVADVSDGSRKTFKINSNGAVLAGIAKPFFWIVRFDRRGEDWIKPTIELRDLDNGHLVHLLLDPQNQANLEDPQTIQISPDGRWLFFVTVSQLRVWDLKSEKLVRCISIGSQTIGGEALKVAALSPDCRVFYQVNGGNAGTWNVSNGKPIARWKLPRLQGDNPFFMGTRWMVYTASNPDNPNELKCFLFDTSTGKTLRPLSPEEHPSASKAKNTILILKSNIAHKITTLGVEGIQSGKLLRSLPVIDNWNNLEGMTPDGNWLYTTSHDGQIWRQRAR